MYSDSAFPLSSNPSVITSPEFLLQGNETNICVRFYYHMFGQRGGGEVTLNGKERLAEMQDSKDEWFSAQYDLNNVTNVVLQVTRKCSNLCDIAIDDVRISTGQCQVNHLSEFIFTK